MPFKNYWTDLFEILTESVKVYTHCVCEVFDNQEIEIIYKNNSTLNTWATLMKQKLNHSQYVEQEQDIFRHVKNSELIREIRCHSDRIFPNLHQCYQWYSAPPFELCFVSSHFASVWGFSKMLLLNFGMFAISDCPFILIGWAHTRNDRCVCIYIYIYIFHGFRLEKVAVWCQKSIYHK